MGKISPWIKTHLKLTKSEIQFAFIILIGSLVGFIFDSHNNTESKDIILTNLIKIDSLEPVEVMNSPAKSDAQGTDSFSKDTTIPQNIASNKFTTKITPQEAQSLSFKKININKADKKELMRLPGIGEATAQKILDYRATSRFNSIDDILNIKGIGPAKFAKLKPLIEVK
ncbi:MAG TPA: ComEA family DNA-binding protein [Candidatus Kapabacteria bacterium]|nr:ComEA family DNA-binding protein [Candidatus Kapabacteria bacterium]